MKPTQKLASVLMLCCSFFLISPAAVADDDESDDSVTVLGKQQSTLFGLPNPFATDEPKTLSEEEKAKLLVNEAVDLIGTGHYDLSEEKIHAALRINPKIPEAFCNLAIIDIHYNNLDAAFMNLETCFMNGYRDFDVIERQPNLRPLVRDRRYQALKIRYR